MNNNDAGIETTDVRLESAVDEETPTTTAGAGTVVRGLDEPKAQPSPDPDTPDEEKKKRSWVVPLVVGIFLTAAIAAVAILLLLNTDDATNNRGRRGGGLAAPDQVKWKVTSYSLGGMHPERTGKAPKEEARDLSKLVRRWHDSAYLFPGDLRADTNKYFTSEAARAVRASGIGLPAGADRVETKKRTARIGIDVDGARRAAAEVQVVAIGQSRKGDFRVASETHLWLEREGSKWKVIAFEVDQDPQPLDPKKGGKGKGKGSKGKGAEGNGNSGGGSGNSGGKPNKGGAK